MAGWLNRAVVRRSLVRRLSLLRNSQDRRMIICKDKRMIELMTFAASNTSAVYAEFPPTIMSLTTRIFLRQTAYTTSIVDETHE